MQDESGIRASPMRSRLIAWLMHGFRDNISTPYSPHCMIGGDTVSGLSAAIFVCLKAVPAVRKVGVGPRPKWTEFAGITCPKPAYAAGGGFEIFSQASNSIEASILDQAKVLRRDAPSQAYPATTSSHSIMSPQSPGTIS